MDSAAAISKNLSTAGLDTAQVGYWNALYERLIALGHSTHAAAIGAWSRFRAAYQRISGEWIPRPETAQRVLDSIRLLNIQYSPFDLQPSQFAAKGTPGNIALRFVAKGMNEVWCLYCDAALVRDEIGFKLVHDGADQSNSFETRLDESIARVLILDEARRNTSTLTVGEAPPGIPSGSTPACLEKKHTGTKNAAQTFSRRVRHQQT